MAMVATSKLTENTTLGISTRERSMETASTSTRIMRKFKRANGSMIGLKGKLRGPYSLIRVHPRDLLSLLKN